MLISVMLWHLLRLNIHYNPWLLVPYKPSLSGNKTNLIQSYLPTFQKQVKICINDDQNIEKEERKQWCYGYSKTDTKTTEEICNTSCYQIRSTNNHHRQNEETPYVHCFHIQTTNVIITTANSITIKIYYLRLWLYHQLTAKEPDFMCLNTYLCTYAHTPINLLGREQGSLCNN